VKLYYMETMNPRKVCATAKYLKLPVDYVPIETVPGGLKGPQYLALNPNGLAPTLTDGDTVLWESAAIMMHLSIAASSDLWPLANQHDRSKSCVGSAGTCANSPRSRAHSISRT
jgi:glutathione S-transferase